MQQGIARWKRPGVAAVTLVAAAGGLVASAAPASALPSFSFTRLAGADRYDTARVIAVNSFPSGADTAVIATGTNYPDALAGNYLAGTLGAPILLTTPSAPVPAPTLEALRTLRTRNVVLLGQTTAVSQAVQDALASTTSTNAAGGNLNVTRIGGATRYDTMRAIVGSPPAGGIGTTGGRRTAIVASGENFPDALALGPVSWALRFPTILTTPNSLSPQATDALTALGIQQVLIAGGPLAVSAATEASINALNVTTLNRFAGADRSHTSRLAADFAINTFGFKTTHFNLATGDDAKLGVDALAGGPHGGKEDPTVNLITNSRTDPGRVVDFARDRASTLTDAHALGGVEVLSNEILLAIAGAAQGTPGASAPTLTAISPASASESGNTSFTITGTNLAGTSSVNFCGAPATSLVVTGTAISGTAPARAPGACTVTVTTPGGTATIAFSYFAEGATPAPTLATIAPTSGPAAGGTAFTLTGTDLTGATAVTFCGTPAAGFTVVNATTITGTTPAGTAGPCNVTVTTPGGTSGPVVFTFVASPTLATIAPTSGPAAGGTAFTLTGTALTGATGVDFCGTPAAGFTVVNATTITGTTPAGTAGACNVTVTTPGGTSGPVVFTFVASPTLATIAPTSGPAAGGTAFTLSGTALTGATGVDFCGTPAAGFTVVNATTITGTTPAGTAGPCNVTVTTPGGTSGPVVFTYVPAPTLATIAPAAGTAAGGTAFTLTGTALTGATAVDFCGTSAAGFTVVNATTITGTTPAGAVGACAVTVTTPGGTSGPVTFTFAGVVQQASGNTGTTTPASVTATLPAGTVAGNTVLLVVVADATVATPAGFTLDASQVNNNGHFVFRKVAVAGETSFTFAPAVAASAAWYVAEVTGLAASPLDQTASTGTNVATPTISTGTTAATAQAEEFLLGSAGASLFGAPAPSFSGWTNGFVEVADTGTTKPAGTNVSLGVATRTATAVGTYGTTATLSTPAPATGIIATYRIAS
jgi:putative cell wall-binding protein